MPQSTAKKNTVSHVHQHNTKQKVSCCARARQHNTPKTMSPCLVAATLPTCHYGVTIREVYSDISRLRITAIYAHTASRRFAMSPPPFSPPRRPRRLPRHQHVSRKRMLKCVTPRYTPHFLCSSLFFFFFIPFSSAAGTLYIQHKCETGIYNINRMKGR